MSDLALDWFGKRNPCRVPSGPAGGQYCSMGGGGTSAARALATYKPATREKQQIADRSERLLAKELKAERTPDNSPFDLLIGKHAVEVKTLVDQKNSKLTCRPESCARKRAAARKLKVRAHTVAVDMRGGKPEYYYAKGVGSFRLGSMRKVTLPELREVLR